MITYSSLGRQGYSIHLVNSFWASLVDASANDAFGTSEEDAQMVARSQHASSIIQAPEEESLAEPVKGKMGKAIAVLLPYSHTTTPTSCGIPRDKVVDQLIRRRCPRNSARYTWEVG